MLQKLVEMYGVFDDSTTDWINENLGGLSQEQEHNFIQRLQEVFSKRKGKPEIYTLKKVLEDANSDAAAIKAKTEELQKASYKLAEEMYKNTQAQGAANAGADTGATGNANNAAEDADYEVVDDDK